MSRARRRVTVLAAALVASLSPGSTGAPGHAPSRDAQPAPEREPIVSGPAGAVIDTSIVGLPSFWGAVLVARDGEPIILKGYGTTGSANAALSADHHFDLGDISAHFTAAAILVLQQEGRIALDDPIGRHLDDVPADKQGITVAHLLSGTAGLDGETDLAAVNPLDRDACVAAMLAAPLKHEVGTAYIESGIGFKVLAAIIERVTGEAFETVLRTRLFEPAGLSSTGFVDGANLDPTMDTERVYRLYGHAIRAATTEETWDWTTRGATGVVTTARDLRRWDRALRGNAVLNADSISAMFTPGHNGFAMGWYVETLLDGTRQASRQGRANGYVTKLVRSLDRDAVVAVLGRPGTPIEAAERAIMPCVFVDDPVTLDARIDPRRQPRNEHGAISFEGGAWSADPVEDGVMVRLAAPGAPHCLEVRMPVETATSLLNELGAALATVGIDESGRTGAEATLHAPGYPTDSNRTIILPPLTQWMVIGAYHGNEGGVDVDDERVTIILADEIRRAWPVVTRNSKDETVRFRAALMNAIRGD